MKRSGYYLKLSWLLVTLTVVSFVSAALQYPAKYEIFYQFSGLCGYSASVGNPVKRLNPEQVAGYEFTILAIVTTLFTAFAIACFFKSREQTKPD